MSTTKFLQNVLGIEGATALQKAVDRAPILGAVLVPRTIVSWLGTAIRLGYEGEIPGSEDSYIVVKKSESGTYSGAVTIGESVYRFDDSSLTHVAAAVGVALGADLAPIDPMLKGQDLGKLGKTIDLLVKTRIVSDELAKTSDHYIEKCRKCQKTIGSCRCGAKDKTVRWGVCEECAGSMEKEELHGQAAPPREPDKALAPIKQPQQQKPPLAKKELKVQKSDTEHVCRDCGCKHFQNEKFVGCICIRDLVKSAKPETTPNNNGYTIQFDKDVDSETMSTFINAIKRG